MKKRKTVTISINCDKALLNYFGNNYRVGEFLSMLIEKSAHELEKSKKINIEIDVTKIK